MTASANAFKSRTFRQETNAYLRLTSLIFIGMTFGKNQKRFALYGALFGVCFPVIGSLLQCWVDTMSFTWSNILHVQAESKLLWIIDTAPLFLGLFASFGGRQMDKVESRSVLLAKRYEEMKELRRVADEANASKSLFLANMSHEIRTPMNAIIGMSYLALKRATEPEVIQYIEKIERSGKSLLDIINDILDFSKVEAGEMVVEHIPFNLEALMVEVADITNVKLKSKPNIEFVMDLDRDLPEVVVSDPTRLRQVAMNLMDNAVKFTEAGEIKLSCRLKERLGKGMVISFSVSDSGIGIPDEKLKTVFEPFRQADDTTTRKYGGTGLGLVITKRLVALLGGDLAVTSVMGQGTTFTFDITCPIQSTDTLDQPATKRTLQHLRVLLVDDSLTARTVLKDMLQSFGFEVLDADSAERGLRLFEESQRKGEHIDLIVADWYMPDVDGLELIERIQAKNHHNHAVLMVTAFGEDALRQAAQAELIDGYLVKPVSPSSLFDMIQESMSRRAYKGTAGVSVPRDLEAYKRALNGRHVLLVEDNEVNLELAQELLIDVGVTCDVARNGQEAIDAGIAGTHDLILMDIQMPVMDGLAATQVLRNEYAYTKPILAMTAHAMQGERDKSLNAGMNEHLTKPIDPHILYSTLCDFIGTTEGMDEAGAPVAEAKASSDAVDSLPDVSGLNVSDGLGRSAGKRALYLRLLLKFTASNVEAPQQLEALKGERDWDALSSLLHNLGGVSGNIGLTEWGAHALDLSRNIREHDALGEKEAQQLADLVDRLREVLEGLSKFFESQPAQPHSTSPKAAMTADAWQAFVESLRKQLNDNNPDALDAVRKTQTTWALSDAEKEQLDRVAEALDDFDFDKALAEITTTP